MSPHERRLRTFLAAIFATHGLLQAGSIVDCGAEKGGEACWLADLAPSRRVHAIEPLASNLQVRASRAPYTCSRTTRAHDGPFFSFSCPRNLWCVHAACSTSAGIAGATSCRCSAHSTACTFAPLVHGEHGAQVEIGRRVSRFKFDEALRFVAARNYSSYVIPEVCGLETRCRNVVCFPRERLPPPALLANHGLRASRPGDVVRWDDFRGSPLKQ